MIHLLTVDEATAGLRMTLGPEGQQGDSGFEDRIIAEYLRQTITDLTLGLAGVYVTSVTNSVRRQLSPVWTRLERRRDRRPSVREQTLEGDLAPDPIRRVMEALSDLRDIEHLGNGYWAPTPLRLVKLNNDSALAIGGLPTRSAAKLVPASIASTRLSRTVKITELPVGYATDARNWQSLEAWLGHPPKDLSAWTASVLAEATRGLRPSAADLTNFEVYRPTLNRSRPQAFRWAPANTVQRGSHQPVFCRAFEGGHFGMRRYWLGTTKRHRGVTAAGGEYPVAPQDARRLQYGIDFVESAPTEVQLVHLADGIELTMTSPLPPEESRLLLAVGEDRSPKPGKFPLRYRLRSDDGKTVMSMLEALGVRLSSV